MPKPSIRQGPPPPPPPPPPPTNPYSGPDYQGFVFILVSSIGKSNHVLTIGMQVNEKLYEVAYITGLWYSQNEDAFQAKPVEGAIIDNGYSIKCSWSPPPSPPAKPTVKNLVLTGSLVYYPGSFGVVGLTRPSAFLDGNVVAYDSNNNVVEGMGPGPVSGTGTKPWVASGSL
jgi:hypothetical protein